MPEELTIDAVTEPSAPAGNQSQTEPAGNQDNRTPVSTETTPGDSTQGTTQTDAGEAAEYTEEELDSIALEQMDINRVPEDRRDVYGKVIKEKKAWQADYTRKYQEIAEFKKQQAQQLPPTKDPMERLNRAYQAGNQSEMGRVFGEYNQAISQVREAILNEKAVDPFSPRIAELEKVEFRLDKESKILQGHVYNLNQNTQFIDKLTSDSEMEILKEVPDFKKKDPEFYKFARTELELDDNIIHGMTDAVAWTQIFASRGYPNAVEMGKKVPAVIMKAISKMYDRYNVGRRIETKIKEPVPLARGGMGGGTNRQGKNADALFDTAKRTGTTEDFAAYLAASSKQKQRR